MDEQIEILLVEDNPGDIHLIQEAFSECETECQIHVTRHGEEARDFVYQQGAYTDAALPDLIFLDLNLPNKRGEDLLSELNDDPEVRRIPVIILSSSTNDADINTAYTRGANAYLVKPVDPISFISLARMVSDFWFSLAELPQDDEPY